MKAEIELNLTVLGGKCGQYLKSTLLACQRRLGLQTFFPYNNSSRPGLVQTKQRVLVIDSDQEQNISEKHMAFNQGI